MFRGRITSVPFAFSAVFVMALAVTFMLFVYPNPDGTVFSFLRLLVIGLVGYLFFHLYTTVNMWEKKRRVPISSKSAPPREGEAVSHVNLTGEGMVEFEESAQVILDLFTSSFTEFSASAYFVDDTRNELVQRVQSGDRDSLRESLSLEDPNIRDLLKHDRPQFLTPNAGEEVFESLFEDRKKIAPSTTVLSSPITIDGTPRGILLIEAEQYSDFDDRHPQMARSHSLALAAELKHLESRSSLRSENFFYLHLHAFLNDLDIERSEDELLASLTRFCESNFSFDKLTVSLVVEDEPDQAVVRAVSGFTQDTGLGDRYRLTGSLHGRVISDGEPIRIDSLATTPDVEGRFAKGDIEKHQFLSFLGVPIKNKYGSVGSLVLESFTSRKYSDGDSRILQIVGERIGALIGWWRDYGAVKETASRDGLTGLLNHRAFMERFEEEINRANRYQENLILLVLDLDKFKRINDTYGHLYGDYVLQETANSLRGSVRNIDLVARYGGEEFTIILINASREAVFQTAKRIVSNVSTYSFSKDGHSVRMTISAGGAEFPVDGTTPRELIGKADDAMYEVKRRGGNDVRFALSVAP